MSMTLKEEIKLLKEKVELLKKIKELYEMMDKYEKVNPPIYIPYPIYPQPQPWIPYTPTYPGYNPIWITSSNTGGAS